MRELDLCIKAYQKQKDYEIQTLMWQALHIAAFTRAKRLPSLKEALKGISHTPKKPKTPEALYAIVKMVTQSLGGEVRSG